VDIAISPANRDIRVRHVVKNGRHCYILFNEGEADATIKVHLAASGRRVLLDVMTGQSKAIEKDTLLSLPAHQVEVIVVGDALG